LPYVYPELGNRFTLEKAVGTTDDTDHTDEEWVAVKGKLTRG